MTNVEYYNKLIANHPTLERKGKTTPYTSLNGHMTSFLSKEGAMGLHLSETDRDRFIQAFDTKLMEQHGRVMKEFVEIPNELLINTEVLQPYLALSADYVSQLKPKPSKKK